ncbi:MAG: hypothetical protein HOE90_22745 [Bacteriovoracaceae bacterium]|nr:hypothetical protein [Bacteriovoracaceae bacterium]
MKNQLFRVGIVGIIALSSFHAFANCSEELTKSSSRTFKVATDFDSENSNVVNAKKMVNRALEQINCPALDDTVSASCQEIVPKNSLSTVCYIESDLGHFFTISDLADTGSVVLNIWD